MPEIYLRSIKGSALTHTEMDSNLQNLINSSSLDGSTSNGSATLTLHNSASVNPTSTYGLGITFPYSGSALISGSLTVTGSIDHQGNLTTTGHAQAHCLGLGQTPSGITGQLNAVNVITTYLSASGATFVSASFGSVDPLEVVMIDANGQLFRTASLAVGQSSTTVDTGSFYISSSITGNVVEFNQGDGTTESVTLPTPAATDTSSFYISSSITGNVLEFNQGDGTTESITLPEATVLDTGSFYISSSITGNVLEFNQGDGTTESLTIDTGSTLNLYSEAGTTASIAGKLEVDGTIVAQEFHTEFVTSSVIFESGSTQFGDSIDDTHNFHGIVDITGSLITTGSIEATGDIIAYASSDERLKDNIELIAQPIDKLKQIKGVSFDWNDKSEHTGHDIGVIAQDIEKILPELVATRDNGYKAVRYEKIVALLIEAIKDQQSQIDELKSKL